MRITPFSSQRVFILFNMPYFSEEINGKMKTVCKFQCRDTLRAKKKEEDRSLPLAFGENYSALAAMT